MAPLRCAIKFDPFLSLDCASTPSGAILGKEGIKFCHLATLTTGGGSGVSIVGEEGGRAQEECNRQAGPQGLSHGIGDRQIERQAS